MMVTSGVDRIITLDVHMPEVEGAFPNSVNFTNVATLPVGAAYFGEKHLVDPVIVGSKSAAIYRAKRFREAIADHGYPAAKLATFVKEQVAPNSWKRRLMGDSVVGRDCILVDDMIDTGTTIVKAAGRLKRAGARRVFVFASHGIFSHNALSRIEKASQLEEVVVSNSVYCGEPTKKIKFLSLAPLIAESIRRVYQSKSTHKLTLQ
tara:strand:- start:74 stop:691 length:618 start_codon:yes stop_codon:yes gene_type:complete